MHSAGAITFCCVPSLLAARIPHIARTSTIAQLVMVPPLVQHGQAFTDGIKTHGRRPLLQRPRRYMLHFGLFVVCTISVHQLYSKRKQSLYKQQERTRVAKLFENFDFSFERPNNDDESVYRPSSLERFVLDHSSALGYEQRIDSNSDSSDYKLARSCDILSQNLVPSVQDTVQQYLNELDEYNLQIQQFQTPYTDLRKKLRDPDSNATEVCSKLRIGSNGLQSIFKSQQTSLLPRYGAVEPILPIMRHPQFCFNRSNADLLLDLGYLVHDFESICLHNLKPYSQIVLLDLGASLEFHNKDSTAATTTPAFNKYPAVYLTEIFRKFGFVMDHIYAYEVTYIDPQTVHQLVPPSWRSAYHWINVGVSAEPGDTHNPWQLLLDNFSEDDLILVKLDIDSPAIEMGLVDQLLADEKLQTLVDHFYFEHHVHMHEMSFSWTDTMRGSLKSSMELFQELRRKGVAAHSWV